MPGLWSPPAGSAHCEFGLRWAFTIEDLKEWFSEHAPSDASEGSDRVAAAGLGMEEEAGSGWVAAEGSDRVAAAATGSD